MKISAKTLLIVLLLMSTQLFAQTDSYQSAMKKGLNLLDSSKSSENFIAAANYFERIANAETKQWLPIYYSAYANLTAGIHSQDKILKDQYFEKALIQVEQADAMFVDNSEIYTLKGYIQFMKMSVDPQSRLPLMNDGKTSLEKAKLLDPKNPRPYLVQGQNIFYTPQAFGGGKTAAKSILEEAVIKYDQFKPSTELAPNWGGNRAKTLLERCK